MAVIKIGSLFQTRARSFS